MDKIKALASTIVNYSVDVQEGEKVLITCQSMVPRDLIKALIKEIVSKNGIPYVNYNDPIIGAYLSENTNDERIELLKKHSEFEIENFDCFIIIRYGINDYESKNVPPEVLRKVGAALAQSHD